MHAGLQSNVVSILRPAWTRAIVFCAAYLCCAFLGRILSSAENPFIGFWLPAGLFVAVLLLVSTRSWGWFLAAGMLANILYDVYHGKTPSVIGLNAATNSFEAFLGAGLVRRFVGSRPSLSSLKEAVGFVSWTAGVSAMVTAALGAGIVRFVLGGLPFGGLWLKWWSGDSVGILAVAPFVLAWSGWKWSELRGVSVRRWLEAGLLAVVLGLFVWFLFFFRGQVLMGFKYLLLPLVIWAALRFGVRGATLVVLLGGVLIAYPSMGHGANSFMASSSLLTQPALMMQWFIAVSSMTGLVVAAVWHESTQNAKHLRDSELRYRTLFDEAVEGIVLIDHNSGMVRDCNQAFLELSGRDKSELAGLPLGTSVAMTHDGTKDNSRAIAIAAGPGAVAEAQIRSKDGKRKIVEVKTKSLNLNGEVVEQYFFHDITARMQAEEERDRLFKLSMDMLCVGGFDGRFKQINPAWKLTLGWSDQEMLAIPWLDLVHPEDRTASLKAWEDLRKGVVMRAFENRFRCKDASYRWLSWNSIPLVEDAMVFAVVRDTTDLRKAVEAVRESEERLRFAMEGANDGLWDVQMKTGAFFLSPRGCEILGYQTGEIEAVAKVWKDLVHSEDLAATNARLKDHIQGRLDVFEVEQRLRMKDGGWKWVLCRGKIVEREPDGTPIRITGTHSDITKRRKAEDDLRTLNSELERRVMERTAQLEAANKELEAFAYSISHDLRAPLRAINGFSNILLRDHSEGLNPEAARFLQLVSVNAQKMGHLIDDLLAFSRLSRQPLRKQKINTAELIQIVLAESQAERCGRQIEVRVGDLPMCQADPALLKQVWINLLSNAFKYTRHCESAVVEVGVLAGEGDSITFFVRDNGAGFDMQYAGKLFGVFQRLHREDEFEGTGVGLAIVQRIVQRHGGRVWAEGCLNQGAGFYFKLPI